MLWPYWPFFAYTWNLLPHHPNYNHTYTVCVVCWPLIVLTNLSLGESCPNPARMPRGVNLPHSANPLLVNFCQLNTTCSSRSLLGNCSLRDDERRGVPNKSFRILVNLVASARGMESANKKHPEFKNKTQAYYLRC